MYIRQNTVKNRLGSMEGGLGQIPIQSFVITDPTDGARLTFTGPVTEIAQVQAIFGLISGAVNAAKSGKTTDSTKLVTSAQNLLGTTGSLRNQASAMVNKADIFVKQIVKQEAEQSSSSGASAGEVLTGVGAILAALAPAGAAAFQTASDAQLAKAQLKAKGNQVVPTTQYIQMPSSGGNTGVIVAVVAGVAVLGVLLIVMSKKK